MSEDEELRFDCILEAYEFPDYEVIRLSADGNIMALHTEKTKIFELRTLQWIRVKSKRRTAKIDTPVV